jgi:hypothetical protein
MKRRRRGHRRRAGRGGVQVAVPHAIPTVKAKKRGAATLDTREQRRRRSTTLNRDLDKITLTRLVSASLTCSSRQHASPRDPPAAHAKNQWASSCTARYSSKLSARLPYGVACDSRNVCADLSHDRPSSTSIRVSESYIWPSARHPRDDTRQGPKIYRTLLHTKTISIL